MEPRGEQPRPEQKKDEGRFFDNARRGVEIFAVVGAGSVMAWFANYHIDVPQALAVGGAAMVAVGALMIGLEAGVLSAYKADSERRMKLLFSQKPEKYVPKPVDIDQLEDDYRGRKR